MMEDLFTVQQNESGHYHSIINKPRKASIDASFRVFASSNTMKNTMLNHVLLVSWYLSPGHGSDPIINWHPIYQQLTINSDTKGFGIPAESLIIFTRARAWSNVCMLSGLSAPANSSLGGLAILPIRVGMIQLSIGQPITN